MHDDTGTTEANMVEMNKIDDSPEAVYFRKTVFYVFVDVVTGLTVRFNVAKKLAVNVDFLWKYATMCESELERRAKNVSSSISIRP